MGKEAQAGQWGRWGPCPASSESVQQILSSLPTSLPDSTSTSSQPSAWCIRPPIYCEGLIQPFSQMGLEPAVPLPGRVPRFPNHLQFSSKPPKDGVATDCLALPCPGLPPLLAYPGSLPPHTCARSLRVCCSPSPSSVSKAACSWSRRDSWSGVGETKKRWSGSLP